MEPPMNKYHDWQQAMVNPKILHSREFTLTEDPQSRFFRTAPNGKPVAIWDDNGSTVVMVNGEILDDTTGREVWLRAAKYPVTEEAYHAVIEGGIWPDLDPAVAAIGDNRRRSDDPESMIDDLAARAEEYGEILDDETSQQAVSLRAAILELHKTADQLREEQKKPHLKAARDVDEAYMPMVKKAKRAADRLRALIEGWETTKRRKAREAEEARQATDARFAATVF